MTNKNSKVFDSTINIPTVKDDLFVHQASTVSDITIRAVLEFKIKLDFSVLQQAFNLSLQKEPILGCGFVCEKDQQPFWTKLPAQILQSSIELVEVDKPQQYLDNYLISPINNSDDTQRQVMLQLKIIRHDKDILCLKMSHIVGDAAALKEYLYLVVKLYNKIIKTPDFRLGMSVFADRSLNQIYKNYDLLDRFKIFLYGLKASINRYYPAKNWSMSLEPGSASKKKILTRYVNNELFNHLSNYCQQHEVTLNDIIVAALFRALHQQLKPPPQTPLRLLSTVDLRRYIKNDKAKAITNLASIFCINIGTELGQTFNDTILKVKKNIQWQKDGFLGLEFHLFSLFDKNLFYPLLLSLSKVLNKIKSNFSSEAYLPLITNMGKLDKTALSFDHINPQKAYLIAPISLFPMTYFGISGFDHSLTISTGFCETVISKSLMQKILDETINQLESIKEISN
jgi:NRPS condensation-like uncharacterized protein